MLLKVADVMQRLNVSQSTVYALIESGQLPHHRIGPRQGAIRVSESDLQQFLHHNKSAEKREEAPKPPPRVQLKHLRL